jgi:hypothetical protein
MRLGLQVRAVPRAEVDPMRAAPRRLPSLLLGVALATTLAAVPASAQDETPMPESSTPPATCALLTAEEASAAFGETLTLADGSGTDCQFDADYDAMRFLSLFLSVATDTSTDEIVSFLCPSASPAPGESQAPCGVDVPVGDTVGAYIPEGFGTMLYVDLGDGDLLALQLVGDPVEGVDRLTALQTLGALALPRVAALPQPVETAGPAEPSFVPDPELEAMFPTEIGGTPLTIDSMSGSSAFSEDSMPQAILDALAAQGKTLDDVSVATAFSYDAATQGVVSITALQVDGVDMTSLADLLVSTLNGDQAPADQTQTTISGKDVTVVTPTADATGGDLQYVYPKDDVLWVVSAVEPALSEVFSKLP